MEDLRETYDVVVIGAGAAGLFCAAEAGKRGRRVLVVDHADRIGEKIRISGGGRCNFTNIHAQPSNFLSQNPHFCKSALARFTPQDFLAHVEAAGIAWHEKEKGQLFCDESAQQIIDMLLEGCEEAHVTLSYPIGVDSVQKESDIFRLETPLGSLRAQSVVVATGGRSIPKIGATGFGYQIAEQFDLSVIEPRPGLVPLTFDEGTKTRLSSLSGVGIDARVSHGKTVFEDALLFTHRGLSGPAILQISSYWREGDEIEIDLAPGTDIATLLKDVAMKRPKASITSVLSGPLPQRLAASIVEDAREALAGRTHLGEISHKLLDRIGAQVNRWRVRPQGSEGYRTAEVTLGGVDTLGLSSKTMEAKNVSGLYFIGEVVDVTGQLGGYNFQWAWASGYAAGQVC